MARTKIPKSRAGKHFQYSPHLEPHYMARGKVWVEKDGEAYVGWGRVVLLERIGRVGSIAAAARSMRMSYRNAWLEVEAMNRLAPFPLVERTTGGVGGGNTRLTEEGRKAVSEYKELRARFQEFLKQFE
jgi:molybdate transport system regulatory protein